MSIKYYIEPSDGFSFNESLANDVIIRDIITKDNRIFLGEAYFADEFAYFYDGNTQNISNLTTISFPPYGIIGNGRFLSILSNDTATIVEPPTTFESNVFLDEVTFAANSLFTNIDANTVSCNNANIDVITATLGDFNMLDSSTITTNFALANNIITANLFSTGLNSYSTYINNLYCNEFVGNVSGNNISCNNIYSNSLNVANYVIANIGSFNELTSNILNVGNITTNTIIGNVCIPYGGNLELNGPATLTNITANTSEIYQQSGNTCNIFGLLTSNSINSQSFTSNFAIENFISENIEIIQDSLNAQDTQIAAANITSFYSNNATLVNVALANANASIILIGNLTSNTSIFQELNCNVANSKIVLANTVSGVCVNTTCLYANIVNLSILQAHSTSAAIGNITNLSSNICNITQLANFENTQITCNLNAESVFVNFANATIANIGNSFAQTGSFLTLDASFLSTSSISANAITISDLTANTLSITNVASLGNVNTNNMTTQSCDTNFVNSNLLTVLSNSNEQSSVFTNASIQTITTKSANLSTLQATTISGNSISATTGVVSYNSNSSTINFTNASTNYARVNNLSTINENMTGNNLNSNILYCTTVTGNSVALTSSFTSNICNGNVMFANTIECGNVYPTNCVGNTCNITNALCVDYHSLNANAVTINANLIFANTLTLTETATVNTLQCNIFICNNFVNNNLFAPNGIGVLANTITIEENGTLGNLTSNFYLGNQLTSNILSPNIGHASTVLANTLNSSFITIANMMNMTDVYANLGNVILNTTNLNSNSINGVSLYANCSSITCLNATLTDDKRVGISNVTTINTVICGVLSCTDFDYSGNVSFSNINSSEANSTTLLGNNLNVTASLSIDTIQSENISLTSLSGTYGTCDTITSDSIALAKTVVGSLSSNTLSAQSTIFQDVNCAYISSTSFDPSDLQSSTLSITNLSASNVSVTQQINVNSLNLNNFNGNVTFNIASSNVCIFSDVVSTVNTDVTASSISMENALNNIVTISPNNPTPQTGLLLTKSFVDTIMSVFSNINSMFSQFSDSTSSFLNLNFNTMPVVATITSAIVFSPEKMKISGSNPVNIGGSAGMFSTLFQDSTTHAIICDSSGNTTLAGATKSSDNDTLTIQIDDIGMQIFIPFVEILSMIPSLTNTYSNQDNAYLIYTVPIGLTYFGFYIANRPFTSTNLQSNNIFIKTVDSDITNSNFGKVVIDNGSTIFFYQRFLALTTAPPSSIEIIGEVTLSPATSSTQLVGNVYLDSNSNVFMTALTSNISTFLQARSEPSICPLYRVIAMNGALNIQSYTMPTGYVSNICPYDIVGTPNTINMSILLQVDASVAQNNTSPMNNCNCIIQDFTNATATIIPGSNAGMTITYGSNVSYDSLLFANITSQANTYYVDANNMVYSLAVSNVYHYWGIYNDNSTPPNIFPVEGISFISISDAQNIFNSYSPYQWTTITQSGSLTNQSNGPVNTNNILTYYHYSCAFMNAASATSQGDEYGVEAISTINPQAALAMWQSYNPILGTTNGTVNFGTSISNTAAPLYTGAISGFPAVSGDLNNSTTGLTPWVWTTVYTNYGSTSNSCSNYIGIPWNVHTVACFYWYHYCGCIFSITSGPTQTQIPIEAISMVSKADAENIFNTYVPANSATQMTGVISGDIEETYANVILQTGTYGGNSYQFAAPNQFNVIVFGGSNANWTQVYSIGPYSNAAWTSKISAQYVA